VGITGSGFIWTGFLRATFVLNVPIAALIADTVVERLAVGVLVEAEVLKRATYACPFGSTLAKT
jgi:hypothetical protein